MNNLCVVDTSVWIYALRKRSLPEVRSLVERLIDKDRVLINPVIKLELLAGTRTRGEFSRLKMRLDALPEIAMNEEVWETAQNMAFLLRKKGLAIPLVDTIIMASAKSASASLIHNDRHFDMAKKFVEVRIEGLRLKLS